VVFIQQFSFSVPVHVLALMVTDNCIKMSLLKTAVTAASSVGFAFMLKLHFVDFFKFLIWVVFIDCIGVGVVIATTLW